MSGRTKRIILALATLQILTIILIFALPKIVMTIPGRYRVALAERSPVLSQVTEDLINQIAPVATALPAPVLVANQPQVIIPAVSSSTPIAMEATPAPQIENDEDEDLSPQITSQVAQPVNPTATPIPTIVYTPTPLPDQVLLSGIPRIQQSFNNCGPANLTQVLNWYGDETSQAQAAAYLKPNAEDRNVSPWQLSDYVNSFTELRSTVHSGGDMEMLKRFVAAGLPVVIEKGYEPDTSSSQGWFGHYLTVFGYDEKEQVFHSMDSYLKVDEKIGRIDSYEDIEYYWQHFNYNFYVVYEPEREAEVFTILGEEMLQPLKMWEESAKKAQEEVRRDPENSFAWFNLGTSLTRLGELTGTTEFYENGAAAFDQARTIGLPPRMLWYEFRPYLAYMKVGRYDDMIAIADTILATQGGQNVEETFLYKGHALLFQGDVSGAITAYKRALELNENFYPAEIALESLS